MGGEKSYIQDQNEGIYSLLAVTRILGRADLRMIRSCSRVLEMVLGVKLAASVESLPAVKTLLRLSRLFARCRSMCCSLTPLRPAQRRRPFGAWSRCSPLLCSRSYPKREKRVMENR